MRALGPSRRWTLHALFAAVIALALLAAGLRLAIFGVRSGDYPLLDGLGDFFGAFCVGLVLWVRGGEGRPSSRRMWHTLSAAVFAYVGGTLLQLADRIGLLGPLGAIPSALSWGLSYVLMYGAIVHLLRQRVRQFHASIWLDGLVSGLTVAAVTVGFLLAPVARSTGGDLRLLLHTLLMPVGDILLLVLLAGVFAVIWRAVSLELWLLAIGLVVFVSTDMVFALQLSSGSYVYGGAVDLGWVLAQVCLAVAAVVPSRQHGSSRFDGVSVLVVPGMSAVGAVLLLFYSTLAPLPPLAQQLALAAVTTALARTVLTFREIRALADSRREARTDDLTGLPNLRRFLEELARVRGPAARNVDCAVLVFDIDHFREINDLHGHAMGDDVIQAVGERLAEGTRSDELVARLDGDAFAVLAHRVGSEEAVQLAQRLRNRLKEPLMLGVSMRAVEASVGVAITSPQVSTGVELLQLADLAMYAAKSRRAGVLLYDHDRDGQGRHRAETIEQLRQGIERGELRLHYQPKLDLRAGRVTGTEALVRWQHPTRGLLYPDAFVDLAETSGLMPRLTHTVLDLALAQVRQWHDSGLDLTVAVNVSTSDLMDHAFPDIVETLLRRHDVPPACLVIEVTESLLMADRAGAVHVLGRLTHAGITVAIDDYGTGYSSLAYLADLPVGELKLDRAFVGRMTSDRRRRTIVTSTIKLAHALGLSLTAEGVEDQDTLDALTQEGCDVAQGYHISRPVPAERLTELLVTTAVETFGGVDVAFNDAG